MIYSWTTKYVLVVKPSNLTRWVSDNVSNVSFVPTIIVKNVVTNQNFFPGV